MRLDKEIFSFIQDPAGNDLSPQAINLLKELKLSGLIKDQAKKEYKAQWLLNQVYLQEIKSWILPSTLFERGTLLKGIHLLSTGIYDHPGMRFMGDVDLLVAPEDLSNWENFLLQNGYQDITKGVWEANSFKKIFLKESQGLELVVELHTRLFYQETSTHTWEKQAHPSLSGLLLLKDEDLYVHLCGHLAYQHTFISLHWLYDIYCLLKKTKLNWREVEVKAREANVLKSCQMINFALKKHFKMEDLYDLGISSTTKRFCNNFLTSQFLCYPTHNQMTYWLIKHLTKDDLLHSLSYDFNWIKSKIREKLTHE